MSSPPENKKQRTKSNLTKFPLNHNAPKVIQEPNQSPVQQLNDPLKTQTPKKPINVDKHSNSISPLPSQSLSSSILPPTLQPPEISSRGRGTKSYSQSPPRSPCRSPARSPTRKLELIQLSPVKNSRSELQKIYNSKQEGKIERICLNKLVLHNFKSYAGEQTIGPFHSTFSAVVGPNGSGKSNVIDSMLFVFGFRATKMRQDKLSDLIHKSEQYPNLTTCSVDVHFEYLIDYPDGTTKINPKKSPLIITRKAFKNSSSKYYINHKESNYTKITALLKEEGIDLDHNRFLILQGEVENIAQMKPKAEKEGDDGLLEYLEDIIGTARYKELIDNKFVDMEALNEVCIEKENRFNIIHSEKNSLESEKDVALEYLNKEKQQTIISSKLLQVNIWKNNQKLSKTLEKISKLKEEYELKHSKQTDIKKEIELIRNSYDEIVNELDNLHNEEKEQFNKKRKLDSEKVASEEQIKNINNKIQNTDKDLRTHSKNLTSYETKLKGFDDNKTIYEDQIRLLDQNLKLESELLEKMKFDLKDKTATFSDEISKHEKDLEPWNLKLDEIRSEKQLKESEKALIEESYAKLQNNIKSIDQYVKEKEILIKERKREVSESKNKLQSISKEIEFGSNELKNANEKLAEMQVVLNQDRQKTLDARTSLLNIENRSKVLRSLMKLQKSGRITGFHGRLGDLGVIDEKYDIAISTACPRLEDIVVDSVECGQQCIEYLRKNKLGYARFILLDKLSKFNMEKINTPLNVLRLFDLIKVKDSKFLPAFYSVLRNTLVANDLKEANSVAYGNQRYRVVTLDGNLIDISGTMSGGGNRVSKGGMLLSNNASNKSLTYSPEEVEEMEKELSIRERNYQNAYNTVKEMEVELRKLKESEPNVELGIAKLGLEVDSLENECTLKRKQLAELGKSLSADNKTFNDIHEMENLITNLEKEQESIKLQMKSKIDRIDELKNKIMKVGGIELQMQNSKVDSIMEQKNIINKKQKSEKNSCRKIESDIKKTKKLLKNLEVDFETSIKKRSVLEEELKIFEKLQTEIESAIGSMGDRKSSLTETSEKLKDDLSDMEESLAGFKTYEVDYNHKLEGLNSVLTQIKISLKDLEGQLSSLKIREVKYDLDLLNNKSSDKDKIKLENSESLNKPPPTLDDNDTMPIDEDCDEISKGIPRYTESEFEQFNIADLEAELLNLKDYFDTINVDIDVLEEYTRRMIEYNKRKIDLNQSVELRDTVKKELENLKKARFDEFMESFNIISMTLKEMYQIITMGGNAELELVDSLDPFSEGVTFSVMPPKKSWRNISNLSGGEKTLSSLALVFALHKYKPTPLYVMDEIDAALDFRNVSIVANYIKERTKNAQFIVISLRNNMFELAEQLVGIYKNENQTKSATLKNDDIIGR